MEKTELVLGYQGLRLRGLRERVFGW
uniref:Uncharacterized protein n=1 Tax=Solanum lycopersicum TaxID=4081 RepID=K4CCU3_SOLLC